MNDTGEATYAVETVRRFLRARRPLLSAATKTLLEMIQEVVNGWASGGPLQNYVTCFSENGDRLSQWRAYGYGRGLSVEFEFKALNQLVCLSPENAAIGKVLYEVPMQQDVLSALFDEAEDALNQRLTETEAASTIPEGNFTPLTLSAAGFLARLLGPLPFFKNVEFAEEAEVRIHAQRSVSDGGVPEKLEFRDSALGLTPYITIPLWYPEKGETPPIRRIIIGPQTHQHEAQRAVKQFLAVKGMPNVQVDLSQVPLRA
jgi:hypothetical protein